MKLARSLLLFAGCWTPGLAWAECPAPDPEVVQQLGDRMLAVGRDGESLPSGDVLEQVLGCHLGHPGATHQERVEQAAAGRISGVSYGHLEPRFGDVRCEGDETCSFYLARDVLFVVDLGSRRGFFAEALDLQPHHRVWEGVADAWGALPSDDPAKQALLAQADAHAMPLALPVPDLGAPELGVFDDFAPEMAPPSDETFPTAPDRERAPGEGLNLGGLALVNDGAFGVFGAFSGALGPQAGVLFASTPGGGAWLQVGLVGPCEVRLAASYGVATGVPTRWVGVEGELESRVLRMSADGRLGWFGRGRLDAGVSLGPSVGVFRRITTLGPYVDDARELTIGGHGSVDLLVWLGAERLRALSLALDGTVHLHRADLTRPLIYAGATVGVAFRRPE